MCTVAHVEKPKKFKMNFEPISFPTKLIKKSNHIQVACWLSILLLVLIYGPIEKKLCSRKVEGLCDLVMRCSQPIGRILYVVLIKIVSTNVKW